MQRRAADRGRWLAACAAIASCALVASAALADVELDRFDVANVFFISKSDDRNRVEYGVRLERGCQPEGDRPVFAYWREIERGGTTHGLNLFERRVYDLGRQEVLERGDRASTVEVEVRAVARPVTIRITRSFERCAATPTTTIAGVEARLDHVHLVLAGPGALHHAEIVGESPAGEVREIVRP